MADADGCLFSKYFEFPPPPSKPEKVNNSPMTLLKILDAEKGQIAVAFQDPKSKKRYAARQHLMKRHFYTQDANLLHKPLKYLEIGEVVMANVCLPMENNLFRRVQVQALLDPDKEKRTFGKAMVVDVDDLRHWHVQRTYAIPEAFYKFPTQMCRLTISNYEDLYPKGIFESFFDDTKDFLQIMKTIRNKVLDSLLQTDIFLSDITEEAEGTFIGKFHMKLNLGFQPRFVEEFCNYFKLHLPKEIEIERFGVISDVMTNGDISIGPEESLFLPIDRILNSVSMWEKVADLTEHQQEMLMKRISLRECRYVVVFNFERKRLSRAKVLSSYQDKMKVLLMDTSQEVHLTVKDLVCPLRDVGPILSSLPPQAQRFHLRGIEKFSLTEMYCDKYRGHEVKFKILTYGRRTGIPEVDVYLFDAERNEDVLLNDLLEQKCSPYVK